jgi:DNA-binding GntR family transcriptional regulator
MSIRERRDEGKLSAVGVAALDEQLYRRLLTAPGSTLAELTAGTEIGATRARQAIARLERSGLVSRR